MGREGKYRRFVTDRKKGGVYQPKKESTYNKNMSKKQQTEMNPMTNTTSFLHCAKKHIN